MPFATASAEATRSDATWAGAKWIHSGAPGGMSDEGVPVGAVGDDDVTFSDPLKNEELKKKQTENPQNHQGSGG